MRSISIQWLFRYAVLLALMVPVVASANGARPASSWLEDLLQETHGDAVPIWTFEVVAEFPHDRNAFTEGLVVEGETLYEGTGLKGQSEVRRSVLDTGTVELRSRLDQAYFGEGIAILDDRLYQLTWKSGTAFVYDLDSFGQIGQFSYAGEGWGMTTDGTSLIMSNGSDDIVFRDPETFEITRSISVSDSEVPVTNLNELEWIEGEIWANVWQTNFIARIDPSSGAVKGWIDLTGLLPLEIDEPSPGVLNGIAWDPDAQRLLVTGKNWPTIFQVELVD